MSYIVSSKWLSERMNQEDLVLLDASLPSTIDGQSSELTGKTIPRSRPFDLKNKFSDPSANFPNTVPTAEYFQSSCRSLGVNKNSTVVVFDNMGVYSSPRAWWLFRAMGHETVYVLDGGLPAWAKSGFDLVEMPEAEYAQGDFEAKFDPSYVLSYQDVLQNVNLQQFAIVDARSAGRFDGTEPEPRKHLKSGSIPHSCNIPFQKVLQDGHFKSPEELKQLFEDVLLTRESIVYSCGSGLTACIIMMAGRLAGIESEVIYDGSWTEWAELQNLTVNE